MAETARRSATTSTGTTVRIEPSATSDALVILEAPNAPADLRRTEAGRVIAGAFQPAPFAPWGLTPETLRVIADVIEPTPAADAAPTPHRVEVYADHGEVTLRLTCTAPVDAVCRMRPADEDREYWSADDPDLTPGHECWAVEWIDAAGWDHSVLAPTDGVLASVPVEVTPDDCVVIAPAAPHPTLLDAPGDGVRAANLQALIDELHADPIRRTSPADPEADRLRAALEALGRERNTWARQRADMRDERDTAREDAERARAERAEVLAERGDDARQPAPVVSAEQVRDHLDAYEEQDGQCVSVSHLRSLGIEVPRG